MGHFPHSAGLILLLLCGSILMTSAKTLVPANHPFLQYHGRWDTTDPLHPRHSWPGVSLIAAFTGTSVGIRMDDATNYYNVFIDGTLHSVFHGTSRGETDYTLADSLLPGNHVLVFSKRNIAFDEVFSVGGLLLSDNERLLPPPPLPPRKIEFIGDSFAAAESNEATAQSLEWKDRFPVTNIDKGFGPLLARNLDAEYHMTCRSGSGMFCDWQGDRELTIPKRFDRTLMERAEPAWDFSRWVPDMVVIALGLNDHTGLRDKDGNVTEAKSREFRETYHAFVQKLRSVYPGVRIVAVATWLPWIRSTVHRVVEEEKEEGSADIVYVQYDEFPGHYVANGHPTVETHARIAQQLTAAIEASGILAGLPPR